MRRIASVIVRLSASLAPRRLRARWREEWLAEIDAARTPTRRLVTRAAGAPIDALLLHWTPSTNMSVRSGWTADLRDAWRALVKTPLQTATMIACLAVGAALMVSVFAIANAVTLADPPGVQDRERLVRIGARQRTNHLYTILLSDYLRVDWQRPPDAFEAIAGESGASTTVTIRGEAHQARGLIVTGTYFAVLRSVPAFGRLLEPSDDLAGAPPVVVLGHGFWRRHFSGDLEVIGKPLQIGRQMYEIVGVAPAGFIGLEVSDLGADASTGRDFWIPLTPTLAGAAGDSAGPRLVGRLAGGATLRQAEAQLQALLPDPVAGSGQRKGRLGLMPFRLVPVESTGQLAIFFSLVFSVPTVILLIACANVASLQAVRAAQRRHELALRTSLGATRARLARLLIIETLIMAGAAVMLGWAVSVIALRESARILPVLVEPDWSVFWFALALPLALTLLIGVIPSWRLTGFDVLAGLRLGGRSGAAGRSRIRRAAVVMQVALSIALVFAAVVMSRAIAKGPAGMVEGAPEVVVAGFYLTSRVVDQAAQRAAVQSLIQEASQLAPGGAVAFSTGSLLSSGRAAMGSGAEKPRMEDWFDTRIATPAFFNLLEVKLLGGRFYGEHEQQVMIVNETFARKFSAGAGVVGRWFEFAGSGLFSDPSTSGKTRSRQVIGLVADGVERDGNDRQAALAYLPLDTSRLTSVGVFVRSAQAAETQNRLRAMAARISPTLVPRPLGTIEALMSEEYRSAIWLGRALGGTGTLALLLAAMGLFSLVSASVTSRTHELAVRVALGATRSETVAIVLRDVLRLGLIGLAVGVGLAVPIWLFIQDEILSNATLLDPAGLAIVLAALTLTMFAAAYVPARRAGSVDPLIALKTD